MPSDDLSTFKREKIDRIGIVVVVDLAAVGPTQSFPSALFHEDSMPQKKVLLEHILIQMAVCCGNDVNHQRPHPKRTGSLIEMRCSGYWEKSQ